MGIPDSFLNVNLHLTMISSCQEIPGVLVYLMQCIE